MPGGIGFKELLVLLAIFAVIFGTKKLRSMGTDVGAAVKGFRKAVTDEDAPGLDQKKAEADKTEPAADAEKTS